ncbi:adenine nucleotide alpha hydrolase family protein [Vibrio algarum]|uniref:Electron transfer flavoprotein alpha/beta-subunit N-terminal domain-containing protein n=1 Tax=Vibrio algarum TaxID=3020714 RepID=A0ABT4YUF9_9VIBR|nr:hypothetical protein [Vibrio sp. KJ40-1]MDB1125216.1 hypothetical protein [Vibrio sp. KJ40-1]
MKQLVCFKSVADLDQLPSSFWQQLHAAGIENLIPNINFSFLRQIFNMDDQVALELAMQMRQRLAESESEVCVESYAVTIGKETNQALMNQLLAVGFDHVVRVLPDTDSELKWNSAYKADLLANYAQEADLNLIVMGEKDSESSAGETGYVLSEKLGWPCLNNVIGYTAVGLNELQVCCESALEKTEYLVTLPVVLLTSDSASRIVLRSPTLAEKSAAKSEKITEIINDNNLEDKSLPVRKLTMSDTQRQAKILSGDLEDQVEKLWQEHLKPRWRS